MKSSFCANSYQNGCEKEMATIITTYINFVYIAIKMQTDTN